MNFSKLKSVGIVAEGFFAILVCQAVGGYIITPKLLNLFPSAPPVVFLLFFSSLAFLMAILYLLKRTSYKPKRFVSDKLFFYTFTGIVAAWLVLFTNTVIIGNYSPLTNKIISLHSEFFYPTIFILFILGPCLEEILYRGYFFEILRKPFGDIIALFSLSFLFMFGHFVWSGFTIGHLALFFYSLVFTIVYIKSGLVASIAAHSFVNLCLFFITNGS